MGITPDMFRDSEGVRDGCRASPDAQRRELVGDFYENARSMPGEELPSYAGAVISERFNVTEPFKKVES